MYAVRYKIFVPMVLFVVSASGNGTDGKEKGEIVVLSADRSSSVFFAIGRASGLGTNLMRESMRFSAASMRRITDFGKLGFKSSVSGIVGRNGLS